MTVTLLERKTKKHEIQMLRCDKGLELSRRELDARRGSYSLGIDGIDGLSVPKIDKKLPVTIYNLHSLVAGTEQSVQSCQADFAVHRTS